MQSSIAHCVISNSGTTKGDYKSEKLWSWGTAHEHTTKRKERREKAERNDTTTTTTKTTHKKKRQMFGETKRIIDFLNKHHLDTGHAVDVTLCHSPFVKRHRIDVPASSSSSFTCSCTYVCVWVSVCVCTSRVHAFIAIMSSTASIYLSDFGPIVSRTSHASHTNTDTHTHYEMTWTYRMSAFDFHETVDDQLIRFNLPFVC